MRLVVVAIKDGRTVHIQAKYFKSTCTFIHDNLISCNHHQHYHIGREGVELENGSNALESQTRRIEQ